MTCTLQRVLVRGHSFTEPNNTVSCIVPRLMSSGFAWLLWTARPTDRPLYGRRWQISSVGRTTHVRLILYFVWLQDVANFISPCSWSWITFHCLARKHKEVDDATKKLMNTAKLRFWVFLYFLSDTVIRTLGIICILYRYLKSVVFIPRGESIEQVNLTKYRLPAAFEDRLCSFFGALYEC
jgi:hypothetical protein